MYYYYILAGLLFADSILFSFFVNIISLFIFLCYPSSCVLCHSLIKLDKNLYILYQNNPPGGLYMVRNEKISVPPTPHLKPYLFLPFFIPSSWFRRRFCFSSPSIKISIYIKKIKISIQILLQNAICERSHTNQCGAISLVPRIVEELTFASESVRSEDSDNSTRCRENIMTIVTSVGL